MSGEGFERMSAGTRERKVPSSGINLFQLIYTLIREYRGKTGLVPLNLSLGNPDGIPSEAIRKLQARFAADPGYDYHTYAEENDLNGFTRAMVELHGRIDVSEHDHLRAVPIPGIKTASALIPLACGLHLPDRRRRDSFVVASNLPAYDIIGVWSSGYLGAERVVWPLSSCENMHLSVDRLRHARRGRKDNRLDLVFVIRPGNPTSVGASRQEWKALIEFCIERGARLVNDAAYTGLTDANHIPLASVAKDYKELEWLELYTVSKTFSDPGARLGAMVGSRDFIEDFIMIKGNAESGPVPSVMAAYGEFFKNRIETGKAITELKNLYKKRLDYLVPSLKAAGFRQACPTEAGFFTLWKVPSKVLGLDLRREATAAGMPVHETFNRRIIAETGIVGVHFEAPPTDGGPEPLIRYAVCADVLDPLFQARFEKQLARLRPEYD